MSEPPRTVHANTFRAWGMRFGDLPQNDQTQDLLDHLHAFGVRAGALRSAWVKGQREEEEGESYGTFSRGYLVVPTFDWLGGEIDFSPLDGSDWRDPEDLIRRIVEVTGIPE